MVETLCVECPDINNVQHVLFMILVSIHFGVFLVCTQGKSNYNFIGTLIFLLLATNNHSQNKYRRIVVLIMYS